jgi:hypothetical protein
MESRKSLYIIYAHCRVRDFPAEGPGTFSKARGDPRSALRRRRFGWLRGRGRSSGKGVPAEHAISAIPENPGMPLPRAPRVLPASPWGGGKTGRIDRQLTGCVKRRSLRPSAFRGEPGNCVAIPLPSCKFRRAACREPHAGAPCPGKRAKTPAFSPRTAPMPIPQASEGQKRSSPLSFFPPSAHTFLHFM